MICRAMMTSMTQLSAIGKEGGKMWQQREKQQWLLEDDRQSGSSPSKEEGGVKGRQCDNG